MQRVEHLLHLHDEAGSFLEPPAIESSPTLDRPITEKPGTQIGPYKLLQQIGEGGFGAVFMAEQTEPIRRKVALKIIKPGMDTRQVIARFEAERQALAMMDHPNIARVFDAGTTEKGRPFFVMELVRGLPVTKFCDQRRMTTEERLRLFVLVCQAVQHAHQKGIIHRDLKPSNVLVALYDDKPVPKVIDFGVAKATSQKLTQRTMFTQFGQILGTAEYMSPEQAVMNQLDIDTRSDVYSLGVLLYELLTGETPIDRKRLRTVAFDEMMRIIREEDPPRPSTRLSAVETASAVAANHGTEARRLSAAVRGELDWIVMKALEKERSRRYQTASDLARDVENHLNDEIVLARPPSPAYRLRKFSRQHRGGLITATLVAVSLLVGLGVAVRQAQLAVQAATREAIARRDAEHERDDKAKILDEKTKILKDLGTTLFQLGLTHILSGEEASAREIVAQLREQEDQDLADKLDGLVFVMAGGDEDAALALFQEVSRRYPNDPGSFAALMFIYCIRGRYKEIYDSYGKLEQLLTDADPRFPSDGFFIANMLLYDSRRGLKYADETFSKTRSPITLLYRGGMRARYAMHSGRVEEVASAFQQVEGARVMLGDTVAVRIEGLIAYLRGANALRASGRHDEWKKALDDAKAYADMDVIHRELLQWERFCLAEYYYEQDQKDKAKAILQADYATGWGDVLSYIFLALAYELDTGQTELARGDQVGPFSQAAMAMTAALQGQRHTALENARRLLKEHDTPEIVTHALEAAILAGIPTEELERHVTEKREILASKKLSTYSRHIVDQILPIYGGDQEAEALAWAKDSEYPCLWLSHVNWALAMRRLAESDYPNARRYLEQVVEQRIIDDEEYPWARALLARWNDMPGR